jgi:hypothetical protein
MGFGQVLKIDPYFSCEIVGKQIWLKKEKEDSVKMWVNGWLWTTTGISTEGNENICSTGHLK